MDRDEAIRRAEIAVAWARGEVVQWRDGNGSWRDLEPFTKRTNGCDFFYQSYSFRIKPRPLECWVWAYDDNSGFASTVIHGNVEPMTDDKYAALFPGRWVRMRKVTEE